MASELRDLPRRKAGENRSRQRTALGAQTGDFLLDVDFGIRGHMAELFNLGLEFGDWLLKFEKADGHRRCYRSGTGAGPKPTSPGGGSQDSAHGLGSGRLARIAQLRMAGSKQTVELLEQLTGGPDLPIRAKCQRADGRLA